MDIETLTTHQRDTIEHFYKTLDEAALAATVSVLQAVSGTIHLTGVGKSGFIAQKIAATLTSTGTKAAYLSPLDALHGDIGCVLRDDLVILLSKSGETEELLKLLPFLHGRGASTMSWTCTKDSRLAAESQHALELPLKKELCQYDLAPTNSAVIQLLVGDLISMALMKENNVSKEEYYKNHPSGTIGKKMSVHVDDIMLTGDDVPTLHKEATFKAAILELTRTRKGCVLITGPGNVIEGIFTDGDVKRVLSKGEDGVLDAPMETLMTRSFISVPENITAWEAVQIMQENPDKWVSVVPVTKKGRLLAGLLTMHDILKQGIR